MNNTNDIRNDTVRPGWRNSLAIVSSAIVLAACGASDTPTQTTTGQQAGTPGSNAGNAAADPVTDDGGASNDATGDSTTESSGNTSSDSGVDNGSSQNDSGQTKDNTTDSGSDNGNSGSPAPQVVPTTAIDASRLLNQASFGPTTNAIETIRTTGVRAWVVDQFDQPISRYRYSTADQDFRSQLHSQATTNGFCDRFASGSDERENCWRDWESTQPIEWDFYQQAVAGPDQLRQRAAFALSQLFVTSGKEINGSYGFAHYHQMLRDNAFGNFRELLEQVTLSPLMGDYLDMVDNAGEDPNENYARELLQLFSLGTCLLNPDGTRVSGQCVATFNNEIVRSYAYALSGWTYPAGGVNPWCDECDDWVNPPFLRGEMMAVPEQHDNQARELLSGIVVPANRTPEQAVQLVLDSIMLHQNLAPFISRQMIQHLVTSNPTPAYVARVSTAFASGRYTDGGETIGSGQRGDMQATLAAILLDTEARDPSNATSASFGRLREPVIYLTGAIRALDGRTDGVVLTGWGTWGTRMGQHVFHAPSVFNFYPPNFPLNGTELVAPRFGINNTNTVLSRINFANSIIYWWYNEGRGTDPNPSVPGSTGTQVQFNRFESMIDGSQDGAIAAAGALNELLVDGRLGNAELDAIATAMQTWEPRHTWLANQQSTWQREQVKTAAYLILSSPHYQVQR